MNTTHNNPVDPPADSARGGDRVGLLGIGAAAAKAGVSERALRYYQELGLIQPSACTTGGMRRYSQEDLSRVARIRQLQELLGLNLHEIAVVLHHEDRLAQIRYAYHHEHTSDSERHGLATESLHLQLELRATVEAKRQAIASFLADLDHRITRTRELLSQPKDPADPARQPRRRQAATTASRAPGTASSASAPRSGN